VSRTRRCLEAKFLVPVPSWSRNHLVETTVLTFDIVIANTETNSTLDTSSVNKIYEFRMLP